MFISFTRQLARSGEDVVYGKIIDKNDRVLNYCMYYCTIYVRLLGGIITTLSNYYLFR